MEPLLTSPFAPRTSNLFPPTRAPGDGARPAGEDAGVPLRAQRDNARVKKWIKRIFLTLAVLLVVAQVIRPRLTNPPVDPAKELRAPEPVTSILARSCNDCHSNRTIWPWYSQIAPVSWLLADDVNDGRKEMNFSEWATFTPRRTARKLQEICEQVEQHKMPLKKYIPLHPSAKLSDADRKTLCEWAKGERARVIQEHPEAARPRG